jgi:hypothetical protein
LDVVRPVLSAEAWPPPIRPIETSTKAAGLLAEFGLILDQLVDHDCGALGAALLAPDMSEDLRSVLAQLGAARALAFFHWIRGAGLSEQHAVEAALLESDTPAGRALFATVTTVARQATLNRLISMERMEELVSATDTANKEPPHV